MEACGNSLIKKRVKHPLALQNCHFHHVAFFYDENYQPGESEKADKASGHWILKLPCLQPK
jgi:hypothetical protein